MLLQGAQHAVCGNKAACLEQNTWTLSLKSALCETSFLLVSQIKPLPIFSDLQKHQAPFCMCENVLSFLIVTERGSVFLGRGLEGCPCHLLLPFVFLVRLHSCIYSWKKNGKCARMQILAFKAERKNWEGVMQEFIPLPVQHLVVLGKGIVCHVSLPKNCLDGCHHHFSCMGTHGQPGFGSWWKQTFSLRVKCGPILRFELSLLPWPWQWPWAVLSVAVVQSLQVPSLYFKYATVDSLGW